MRAFLIGFFGAFLSLAAQAQEIEPALSEAQRLNSEGKVVVIEVATRQHTHFSQYPDLL